MSDFSERADAEYRDGLARIHEGYAPEPVVCEECEDAGQEYSLSTGYYPITAMYFAPFFDEQKREHHHDANQGGKYYRCSNGHEFQIPEPKCWCGWPVSGPYAVKGPCAPK